MIVILSLIHIQMCIRDSIYNSGYITAAEKAGAVIGAANGNLAKYTNCFALSGCVSGGIDIGSAQFIEADRLSSDEFAYEIDGGAGTRANIWTTGDPGPLFANTKDRPVYQLTLGNVTGGSLPGFNGPAYYKGGTPISLSGQPEDGYILKSFTLIDDAGKTRLSGSGVIEFTMPERCV